MLDRKKFEAKIGSIIGLAADFDYEDYDDKDDMGSIVARVDLKDLPKTWENWHKNDEKFDGYLSVHFKSRVPPLVPAKLNDLVLVYTDFASGEDDLDVGIVSSVHETPDGTCYGCRHFKLPSYSWHGIELTEESYGGYPTGFYRVLGREEGIALVEKKLRQELQGKIDDLTKQMGCLDAGIVKELAAMSSAKPTTSVTAPYGDGAVRPYKYR